MLRYVFAALLPAACCLPAAAHDTWVETNTNLIRTGDAVHVDLKLGNTGTSTAISSWPARSSSTAARST